MNSTDVKQIVKEKYGQAAAQAKSGTRSAVALRAAAVQ
jgi:hypothetical protein